MHNESQDISLVAQRLIKEQDAGKVASISSKLKSRARVNQEFHNYLEIIMGASE